MEAKTAQGATAADRADRFGKSSTGDAADDGPLQRSIGRNTLLLFVIGDVLGAGIYALVGEVGGRVGGAIWAAFAVALALAVFTAFAYAELVTKYPKAAGAALYVNRAFGIQFVTFMVAFAVMASGVTSAATLSRAFGGDYLGQFFTAPTVLVSFVFLAVMAAINFRGIGESVKVNVAFTIIELGGLLLIILIAATFLADGGGDTGRAFEIKDGESVFTALGAGAALAFFALIGFEDSVNVAEEAKNPGRDYPRALFLGLAIAGAVYLAVSMLASMAVPTNTLAESDGPLLEVAKQGPLAVDTKVFAAIALFAVANSALINLVMASRLVYGMSREGVIAKFFGKVHAGRRTPIVGILFTFALAMILAATGDLSDLADTTVLLLLLAFTLVNISVLVLRRETVEHEHFRTPTFLPVIGIAVSVALMFQKEAEVWTRAGLLLALGVVFYVINIAFARRDAPGQRERD